VTKREAVRLLGSEYHIAIICDVYRSTVSRWKRIPDEHVNKILSVPPDKRKLKRGGLRGKKS
jgi:hypothetical protein